MRAFVIRPFGVKKGIDFDRVGQELIRPALERARITGDTTGEFFGAGSIHAEMFRELLVADLVIADVTIQNANVFYELGIRHALRDKRTVLIKSATAEASDPYPFDLAGFRYLTYDNENPALNLDDLVRMLEATIADSRVDSPLYAFLPNLRTTGDRSVVVPVPESFRGDVAKARINDDGARLSLYSLEVQGMPWEQEGLREIGRAQLKCAEFAAAQATWKRILECDEDDIEANIALGNIYERIGQISESATVLQRVAQHPDATPAEKAEARSQEGRNAKQLWHAEWRELPEALRQDAALRSPLLLDAYQRYLDAFRTDFNFYYAGLNALALNTVCLELLKDRQDLWDNCYGADEGTALQARLTRERKQLMSHLELHLVPTVTSTDVWSAIAQAELKLLSRLPEAQVGFAYSRPAKQLGEFERASVCRQLLMYRSLGVLGSQAAAALAAITANVVAEEDIVSRVVVFTGHRIDVTDRKVPRFPANREAEARAAIRAALQNELDMGSGSLTGIAGGANGGDLLFHEVCAELGVPTRMQLALPAEQFITASVADAGADWVKRFYKVASKAKVEILSEDRQLPRWLRTRPDYTLWERANLWVLSTALCAGATRAALIALWNQESGDGPGGTGHMVKVARERNIRVTILPTKQLFNL